MERIVQKIQRKLSQKEDVLTELSQLSNTELNSFLLELFRMKSENTQPAGLLKQFRDNRFVAPANVDMIKIKETEIEGLTCAEQNGFRPILLSPLTPLGTCSSVGFVHQNNVVSALRGTEIVSDATNVLALKIADDFEQGTDKKTVTRYATTHRHIRGQFFTNPNFTSHFSVFCLASGGLDTGNYAFELSQLEAHIQVLLELLKKRFDAEQLYIKLFLKKNSGHFLDLLKKNPNRFGAEQDIAYIDDFDHNYYKTVQFKIGVKRGPQEVEFADGGDVDWTQKLLGNKKHRLFISGVGLDLMEKI